MAKKYIHKPTGTVVESAGELPAALYEPVTAKRKAAPKRQPSQKTKE